MRDFLNYGDSIDISNDGIDNVGYGLIDSEDGDENGAPRDSAKIITANNTNFKNPLNKDCFKLVCCLNLSCIVKKYI